ncbi:MAG: TonB-dependent receptor [Hyphomonadaceae bacterium]|nr:TonB-dependent receptor [Hyphomonadaceae bacterium]
MRFKSDRNRLWPRVSALGLTLAATPLLAAAQTPATSEDTEEIVVTAERRDVDLMNAPLSASVFSGTDLEERQIDDVDALQFHTPSLSVSTYGQGNLINIRGVGRTEVVTQSAAGVPIYRDGVATFNAYFANTEPYYDIANVQVLRGPQGTFAGQNSTGGAIFIETINPSVAGFDGYAQLQAGNFDQIAGRFALNVPISDTLAVRFAFDGEDRDGFFNYGGTGDADASLQRAAGRVGLLWAPTHNFEAVFKVDYDYYNGGANTYAPIASTNDLFDVDTDLNLYAVDRFLRATSNLTYTTDSGWAFRSITGYQDGRTRQLSDSDGTALPIASLEYDATEEILSQEFNIISPEDRPLKYVLGAYYSRSTVGIPLFNIDAAPVEIDLTSQLVRENTAVFGHVSYDLTPQLQVELGARYNHSVVEQDLSTEVFFFGFPLGATPGPSTLPDDNSTTGKLGLSYQLNEDNFFYASIATGHKNAGLNTSITAPPSFEGEDVLALEAGYRVRLLDDRVTVQLSAYHYDYDNYQAAQFDVDTRQTVILNAPEATSQGIELQIDGTFGATSFNLAAAYADSELGRFFAVDSRNPPPPLSPACPAGGPSTTPQCLDLTGNRLPYSPEFTASAGVQHRFDTSLGSITPRVDVSYLGERYVNIYQIPGTDELDDLTLVNAQVAFTHDDWTVTAFATNLTDEHYIAAKLSGLRVAGAPRQVGVRVFRDF